MSRRDYLSTVTIDQHPLMYSPSFVEQVTESYPPTRGNGFSKTRYGDFQLLSTRRGHLALQSYSTAVDVWLNAESEDQSLPVIHANIWAGYSATTAKHRRLAYEFNDLRKVYRERTVLELPDWYNSVNRSVLPYGADVFLGPDNPFDPETWRNKVPIRISGRVFTAGYIEEVEGGEVQIYVDTKGKTVFRPFNPEWVRLASKSKYYIPRGFDNYDEAIQYLSLPDKAKITLARLTNACMDS